MASVGTNNFFFTHRDFFGHTQGGAEYLEGKKSALDHGGIMKGLD